MPRRSDLPSDPKAQRILGATPEEAARAEQRVNGEARADWRSMLIPNGDGNPRALLANAIVPLRHAPEWCGVLAFNQFALTVTALRPSPCGPGGDWTEQQDRLVTEWLQRAGIHVCVQVAGQAVETVARQQSFHPVRAYLDSLVWDRTPRLDTWLTRCLGVEDSPYARAVGGRWAISGVARVHRPGCKADCALILEGPQGALKSTALRVLSEPWFADELGEMGTKDAAMQTCGVWILELAELESLTRSEVSRVKAFLARCADHFRPPYARRPADFPRQCVFAGTCNQSEYLRDETGGRRFWPVACGRILIDDLKRDKDQLWAEAVVRFRAGEPWWLDSPELDQAATAEQAARYDADPWEQVIADWAEGRDSVSVEQVLTLCIDKPKAQWTQIDKNRVARSLKRTGWERYRQRTGETLEWRYRRRVTP